MIDSNLSINILENQALNDVNKLILPTKSTQQASQQLTDLKSSLNVEDKILQNEVEELKSSVGKGERAKPNLIGQCSLNVNVNETFNTLKELVDAKQAIKPVHSEMNLVTQETLQLHEIVKNENLNRLVLEKDRIENKASSDLVVSMRSTVCTEQMIQEKEEKFIEHEKPEAKNATKDLIVNQEAINIGQNLSLLKGEDLKLLKGHQTKNAIKKLEVGHRSLSVDLKLADEKEGVFEKLKIDKFEGKLEIKPEEAICVELAIVQQKERDLKQLDKDLSKASTDLISSTPMTVSQIAIFEKENQPLEQPKLNLSNATASLNNLNALTIEQVNQQLSTGKLKSKKEKPCVATLKSTKKKLAIKGANLQLEQERPFEKELINEEKCDLKQIQQTSICSSQTQFLENEEICKIEKPKKLSAKLYLSESRQQSIQIAKADQFDTSECLEIETIDNKNANLNIDHLTSLQINEKTLLEKEKSFELGELQTKQASDRKLINLQQSIQVEDVQLIDHLRQVESEKINGEKASVKLIDQQALIKKDVLPLYSDKEFEEKIDGSKVKSDFINQQCIQISMNQGSEKEISLKIKKPKKHKLYPIQFAEQICLSKTTSLCNQYEGVRKEGKCIF